MAKPDLEFYNVKSKTKFTIGEYDIREKNGRFFAVAKAPEGHEAWKILSKVQVEQFKADGEEITQLAA